MTPARGRRVGWKDERGQTMIELALGSALLFMLLFGILELGWAIWQYNLVADLAQEGARYAAVHGSASGSVATSGTVSTYVNTRALGMPVTTTATWPVNNQPGSIVSVTVTHTPARFSGFVRALPTLSSTAQMVIAR